MYVLFYRIKIIKIHFFSQNSAKSQFSFSSFRESQTLSNSVINLIPVGYEKCFIEAYENVGKSCWNADKLSDR